MDNLIEKLNEMASFGLKNDELLLDLCKQMVGAISDLHKVIVVQNKTIEVLTNTVTTHNRVLRSLNAERINDAGQDSRLN